MFRSALFFHISLVSSVLYHGSNSIRLALSAASLNQEIFAKKEEVGGGKVIVCIRSYLGILCLFFFFF